MTRWVGNHKNLVGDFGQSDKEALVLLDLSSDLRNETVDFLNDALKHRLRYVREMRNQFTKR